MEIQTTFASIDKTFPVPEYPVKKETETKFIEIEITKILGTTLYLKVPKSWTYKNICTEDLVKAINRDIPDSDWDDCGWERTLEWEGIKEVPEVVAKQYKVFDLTEKSNEHL